jgi:hypothetical protein
MAATSSRNKEAIFDLVSFGRRGPGRSDRLSPIQIAQVTRTVRRVPEVLVKVSGGGTSPKAVTAHFKYLNRRKEFEIESDEGKHLQGRDSIKKLVDDWELNLDAAESNSAYSGRPGRKPTKLVHNIVLSMPAGTPPTKLFAASQSFAREQFALMHRYAMVLHTDQPHPHVHLVVKAMSEEGARMNIRKATLREWRREFARHLREHGIEANATERAIRGVTYPRKLDGIYRSMHDPKRFSTHIQRKVESVATDLLSGGVKARPGKSKLIATRNEVERGWQAISDILARAGQPELAIRARRFADAMAPPQTEREWIAAQLIKHLPPPPERERAVVR